ncbi:MAG: LytTR family DNA-binding domain-containing protein [Duncaniella sp.]|nr:response regulator transcription factor [Bacteroides sp.]MDE5828322.1 LytTR family DNA-binding domain-containing protein [Duncaniella sp.]MBD5301048.1 response regulator transcription factor [Bacteroides sp.]MBD5353755.1 response regulator transcription factor [Bacteroides sp.]MDE6062675.1 LytTR family DNA-binding domain-containing protein [Duncaniella sp.]
MSLRCCVIDDEPLASGLIASYIEKTPFMELIGEFSSPKDAISTILNDNVDVVFLDIQMPQLNGIEFAKIIPATTRIIFTTAYSNYAVEGFRVNALDYLLKPISYEEFLAAANRALSWHELNTRITKRKPESSSAEGDYIIIKSEYKLVQININEIVYIEGLKDYVKIYIDGTEKSIMTLLSMKALEQTLPSDIFMRVHRSFIVNLSKIRVIERNRILFGKVQIPISDSYKDAFSEYINNRTIV